MSDLLVEVALIDKLEPHCNAERLEIVHVGGWPCIIGKDTFKAGDKVVYVPPDTCLPKELTDKIGVTQHTQTKAQGQRTC